MTMHAETGDVQGYYDERFAQVAKEFRKNLVERGELGASVAVTVEGKTVVDLWSGFADAERRRPWEKDTLCVVMSCTKGVTALCAHMLAALGELDFDEPVSRYWPEFAAAGKEAVLVRHLLSHQAGLPAMRAPLKPGAFYDWDYMVERLSAEEPFWRPGSRHGYHAFTFGFLVGEVVRRITGQSIGEFFRVEVAEPLGLDLWMGLPPQQHARVSHLNPSPPPAPGEPVSRFLQIAMTEPASVQALMMANTGGYFVPEEWDSPAALSAVMPSTGGVGNARALAAMYRAIVHDRCVGRVAFEPEDIVRMGAVLSAATEDAVICAPGRWTLGFLKGTATPRGVEPPARVILSEDAFGHTGIGGSIGFCDPVADMSFGYVMNQMTADMGLYDTGESLVDAVYRSLGYRSARHGTWVPAPRARPLL
jgi:CubicO group peptidase (beta-lactamase class C family)